MERHDNQNIWCIFPFAHLYSVFLTNLYMRDMLCVLFANQILYNQIKSDWL